MKKVSFIYSCFVLCINVNAIKGRGTNIHTRSAHIRKYKIKYHLFSN
jgi:hypothetical protein